MSPAVKAAVILRPLGARCGGYELTSSMLPMNYQFTSFSHIGYNRIMKTELNTPNLKPQNATPHFLGLCLLSAILMLASTGCKQEAGSNANTNPTGVYTLVSVDGKSVPCSLTHEAAALTIKSGVFTIKTDSSCSSQITFSVPSRGDMSREVKATYTRQGAQLTMQWEGAGMTMGNVNGNSFTMTNEGTVFAYRK
jgi:hypothetical protein